MVPPDKLVVFNDTFCAFTFIADIFVYMADAAKFPETGLTLEPYLGLTLVETPMVPEAAFPAPA